MRSLACSELADDEAIVARLKTLYDTLDTSTTPASVLVPWFPSPSMLSKLFATKKIYDIVNRAIEARIQSGVPQDDTLQIMLDNSDDRLVMLGVRDSACFPRNPKNLIEPHACSSSWVCWSPVLAPQVQPVRFLPLNPAEDSRMLTMNPQRSSLLVDHVPSGKS